MHFLNSLKQTFGEAQPSGPPENLSDLLAMLDTDWNDTIAHFCREWARIVRQGYERQHEQMAAMRGEAARLWEDQAAIYHDLVEALENPQPGRTAGQLRALIEELEAALEAMERWSTGREPRCLSCGWNGPGGVCPYCHVRVLQPIRRLATSNKTFVDLDPEPAALFQAILEVLEGRLDVGALEDKLEPLLAEYRQLASLAGRDPSAGSAEASLQRAVSGLEEMERVFDDSDAQHLEDGWSRFFQADLELDDTLADLLEEESRAPGDSITLSNEE